MNDFVKGIKRKIWWMMNRKKYGTLGARSYIDNPLRIDGPENIHIGSDVTVKYKTWLASLPQTSTDAPKLHIRDGSIIGNFNHIFATKEIIIEEKVLIADKVYISDNLHSYTDTGKAIMDQEIKQITTVRIGAGSWIGENVCIIGAKIGRNCTIGANSVVVKDIPDYSVAVGSPARIIKQYNLETKTWVNL